MSRSLLRLVLVISTGWISGAPVSGNEDPLAALCDEFDDAASLEGWRRHHSEAGLPDQARTIDIDTSRSGHLTIEPEVSAWFEDYRGIFLFQEVTGDFAVTTRLEVTALDGGVPSSPYSLAGLMVRAPRVDESSSAPGEESWLFLNTGGNDGQPRLEWKTTTDSRSTLQLLPTRVGPVELRIERRGAEFRLLRRFDGEDRELIRTVDRPDLPDTVQVGPDAYTDWGTISASFSGDARAFNETVVASPPGNRDLIARYDYVRFETLCESQDCRDNRTSSFVRGDANADGSIDVSDAVATLVFLFLGSVELPCDKSADADDSGFVELTDAIALLGTLFLGAAPPPAPFPECGEDATDDSLDCESFEPCA